MSTPNDRYEPNEEWDITVQVTATVTVKARPNPDYFHGWEDREPEDAAVAAVLRGYINLASTDGFADLIGEAEVIDAGAAW